MDRIDKMNKIDRKNRSDTYHDITYSSRRAMAGAVGRPARLLCGLLGMVVGVLVRAFGLLLINARLVVPAATSKNLSRSFAGMFWGSMIVSVLAGLCGLIGGDYFGFPPAPSIVAAVVVLFVLSQFGRLWVRQPALES